mmetsp:Transcript_129531/g.252213  ORF Transcript_129531/g.252213 Transcript_129531/m.252213 type:complete len:161 (-) Transcript_129531:159-641(-)
MTGDTQNLGLAHLCSHFLLPPLGIYWRFGCGWHLLICTLLTACFWVPGLIYASLVLFLQDWDHAWALFLGLLVPPLGVYWRFGCGLDLLICLVLTICFHVPGAVYAMAIIALKDSPYAQASPRPHASRSRGKLLQTEDDLETGNANLDNTPSRWKAASYD